MVSFTAAVVIGYTAGHDSSTVIVRAILVMVLCWVIGYVIGVVAQRAVDDQVHAYKQQNPLPELPSAERTDQGDPADATRGEQGMSATSPTTS